MGEGGGEGQAVRYTTADGLADDRVFVFHGAADGTLWIGTHDGLSRFKDGRLFTFRVCAGVVRQPYQLAGGGQFRSAVVQLQSRSLPHESRGAGRGRRRPEVTGHRHRLWRGGRDVDSRDQWRTSAGGLGPDGRLWFPTADGVVVIDPRAIEDSDLPPPAVIEQVVADDEVIYGDGLRSENPRFQGQSRRSGVSSLSTINHQLSTWPFAALACSSSATRRVPSRTRNGHGSAIGWRSMTRLARWSRTERLRITRTCRPGDYRFEVKAASARGAWNETPAGSPSRWRRSSARRHGFL